MTGTWELTVQDESGRTEPAARIAITQSGNVLKGDIDGTGEAVEITLNGLKLTVLHKPSDRMQYTFTGTLDPGYTRATGEFEFSARPTNDADQEERNSYAAEFSRLNDDVLQQELHAAELESQRKHEAKTLFEALQRFAARNDGEFPSSLTQLPASDLPDPSIVAAAPGRRIVYNGAGQGRVDREDVDAIFTEFSSKPETRDNLIELERRLHEVWGSDVPARGNVLRIEYDNPPYTITVGPSGSLMSVGSDPGAGNDAATNAALRATEFNNMKQLMLIVKMFANEHKESIPGGWLMTYPEYLTDPSVLRSPWAPEGTLSYDLLFPGETETGLIERAIQLFESGVVTTEFNYQDRENPAWSAVMLSEIPLIVSRDNLPTDPNQPPSRAVAFLDGHVEAVPIAQWDARIAPFIAR